jgi:protein-L-isoaspartate(D-aspartate) O-methyltransferase
MKEIDFTTLRNEMVDSQIAGRGIRSPRVLNAMRRVHREDFLPDRLWQFAYEDAPVPIAEGQTISQPYIVALMTEALELRDGDKVLEIGTGSGYAAAVLSLLAKDVYTVERIGALATEAAATLAELGYLNVHVWQADGTRGWSDHAPYDAIVVAAGGPAIPESLKEQLKIGGRLVIPVGVDQLEQELIRVTRLSETEFKTEDIGGVRFVPLLGEQGWPPEKSEQPAAPSDAAKHISTRALPNTVAMSCQEFESIDTVDLEPLLRRIGDARIVLLGESTHGTSEFYRMRERISRELIEKKGFDFIAIEGDWPDAARIDHYVRHAQYRPSVWTTFARFPIWMWRNQEVLDFVGWLRARNADADISKRVAFRGLDLYSLHDSIRAVLAYLDQIDPLTAEIARARYGCLTPWQADPAAYGKT